MTSHGWRRALSLLRFLAVLKLLSVFAASAAAEIRVTDDNGQTLVLQAPARRIISLAPHTTELLFAAGAGTRIVGADRYSDHPPEARKIPRIGDSSLLDIERIVALKPDLIVVWLHGTPERQLSKLRALRIPVFHNEPRTLADISRSLAQLGRLAGTEAYAEKAAGDFAAAVAELRSQYAGRPPVTLFYQLWTNPLLTINREHLISDVVRLCGGTNIFSDLKALVPTVSVEAVVAAKPEVIVTTSGEFSNDEAFRVWKKFPSMRAVARNAFIILDSGTISRHSPQILDGARLLCQRLDLVRGQRKQ